MEKLTNQEFEALGLLARGKSIAQVAHAMSLSEVQLNQILDGAMPKLEVSGHTELVLRFVNEVLTPTDHEELRNSAATLVAGLANRKRYAQIVKWLADHTRVSETIEDLVVLLLVDVARAEQRLAEVLERLGVQTRVGGMVLCGLILPVPVRDSRPFPRLTVRPPMDGLSRRELHVAELVARGLKSHAIANELCLGTETVRTHIRRILNTLNMCNRASIARYVVIHVLTPQEREAWRTIFSFDPTNVPANGLQLAEILWDNPDLSDEEIAARIHSYKDTIKGRWVSLYSQLNNPRNRQSVVTAFGLHHLD